MDMADGMPPLEYLVVPRDVALVDSARGLRLVGPHDSIAGTVEQFRRLKDWPDGSSARLEGWTLVVSDTVPVSLPPRTISMPGRAWNIAASILRDVAHGDYENPMDFSAVGYLAPAPIVDIGVEITDI